MFTNEKIAEMTKMDDIMTLPQIKITTREDYEKNTLKFYVATNEIANKYNVDKIIKNVLKIINKKEDEIEKETDEKESLYDDSRHIRFLFDFFIRTIFDRYTRAEDIDLLKKLLNEAKDADIEEVKEKLAKEYTPYYLPRVTDLFNLDEFKRALANRKKLYIIADRLPNIKNKALDYVEMALDAGYQAFLEIDGVTKEIKYLKREETEQTPVGCVIIDLHAINFKNINLRKTENSDLFIFLKNTDYKEATKYFNLHNAHEERWHNTRKKVAVYYYKEGENHPCDRITKGYSLYTNAFHYECYQRDFEERKEKVKEDSLGYIIEKLHDTKKEGSNLKNIIKRAKGEDAQLTEKEQEACEIIKNYTTHSIFEEEDKAEILNTALALVEEPEEKEELPNALPCINESFDLIAELTENKTLLPDLIINDIKTRAKADGYTINQVRQLFEKAIRAEEEADELSEDAQIQNAFYKLFKRLDADYYNPERHNILYLIYTILQDYSIFTI